MVEFVDPGGRYVFRPETDTVETHLATRNEDGGVSLKPTFVTTTAIFLEWGRQMDAIRAEIARHRARDHILTLPKGKRRAG